MTIFGFLFGIEGRVRRREFWLAMLVFVGLAVLLVTSEGREPHADMAPDVYVTSFLTHGMMRFAMLGLLLLVSYTVAAKRFHDRGRSGWWLLTALVPVVGWAWLAFELLIMPGTAGDNRFGPHPTFGPDQKAAPLRVRYKA